MCVLSVCVCGSECHIKNNHQNNFDRDLTLLKGFLWVTIFAAAKRRVKTKGQRSPWWHHRFNKTPADQVWLSDHHMNSYSWIIGQIPAIVLFILKGACYCLLPGTEVLHWWTFMIFFFPTKVSLIVGFILSRFRSKPRPNSRSFWNRCIFLDFYSATTDKDTHRAHDHKPNSGQEARRSLWSLVRGCCFIDWMKTQQTQS